MRPFLTHSQRIGIVALLLIIAAVETFVLLHPQPERVRALRPWEQERHERDSIRQVRHERYLRDSLMWDSMRVARREKHIRDSIRWDSIRARIVEDSLRRDSIRHVREAMRDSLRRLGHEKRDTILCLNTADTASLQFIRGIGPHTAARIVIYREQLGGYVSTEQVREIEGYESTIWDSILPHLMVCDTMLRTMAVNRASVSMLTRHPYLSFSQAKAIYELRRRRIRLSSMSELKTLLPEETREKIRPYLIFE